MSQQPQGQVRLEGTQYGASPALPFMGLSGSEHPASKAISAARRIRASVVIICDFYSMENRSITLEGVPLLQLPPFPDSKQVY